MQEYQIGIRALIITKQQQKECMGRGSSEKFCYKNLEEDGRRKPSNNGGGNLVNLCFSVLVCKMEKIAHLPPLSIRRGNTIHVKYFIQCLPSNKSPLSLSVPLIHTHIYLYIFHLSNFRGPMNIF